MIVIRLNIGNITVRQKRPRRDTFVNCQRYVSLLSANAKQAKEPWVSTTLYIFSVALERGWNPNAQNPQPQLLAEVQSDTDMAGNLSRSYFLFSFTQRKAAKIQSSGGEGK